jgi:hypothetical protein
MTNLGPWLLSLSILCLVACRPASLSDIPAQDDASKLLQLKVEKANLDSLFEARKPQLSVYGQLRDSDSLINVDPSAWNPEIVRTFWPLVDTQGRVRAITESPVSESGDWVITYTHYFDSVGHTFAFERKTSFYNSICTPDLAHEIRTQFFAPDGVQLDSVYHLSDAEGKSLLRSDCQFPYDHPYAPAPTQADFWAIHSLPIQPT